MSLRNIFFFMYIKTRPLISNPKRTNKTPFISGTTSILVEKKIWQLSACWVINEGCYYYAQKISRTMLTPHKQAD